MFHTSKIHVKLQQQKTVLVIQAILAISIISLSSFVLVSPVKAQSIAGSLTFTRSEDFAFTGLIDQAHGFAYFGTDNVPGTVVKVRLSDFTKVSTLVLNPGENFLSAGVIDPANDVAYFGTFSFPGHIVKVRLSTLTRVGSIDLGQGIGAFTTAIIDSANGFAYFGTFFPPGLQGSDGFVVKVNLSTFTLAGTLRIPNGVGLFGSAIDSNGFGYFSTFPAFVGSSNPGTIFKIRLSDLTVNKTLAIGPSLGATPLMDGSGTFSYWPTLTNPGSIVRVRNSDLTLSRTLTLNLGEADPNSAVVDTAEGFAYFATGGGFSDVPETAKIIKINLATFDRVNTLTLGPGESLQYLSAGGVIQTETSGGNFGYFSTYTSPSFIIKVKLSDMSRAGTLEFQPGEEGFTSSIIDTGAGYVYFPSDTGTNSPGVGAITRIRTSDFSNAGTLFLPLGEGPICSSVIDTTNGFAYFATRTIPAKIIKVRLSDFSRVAAITLNPGEISPCAAVIDTVNGFAYFGTITSPSNVVKIRLSDFTRVGAIQLASPSQDFILSAVIDVSHGFAYFGTDQFPAVISKVRLSDFTEVGSLVLNGGNFGEDEAASAVIDPAGGFAYFGTLDTPAVVVKVRLSDFSENMSLTLNGSETFLEGAVIDTTHGFAYFAGDNGFDGPQGVVVKVQLSTMREVGSVTTSPISGIAGQLQGASIDVAGGAAYFGNAFANPGIVYKVSL